MQRNSKSLDNKNAKPYLSDKPENKFINQLGWFLVVFSTILYITTINHYYVLDDYSVIVDNTVTTKGISAVPDIFTHFYRYGYFNTDDGIYRPLSVAMFAVEWSISPNNPRLSHFINIVCYALTAWVLFQCLVLLLRRYNLSFVFCSALLFIAHPVHTEVVANVKSRDEILAFLFSILSLKYLINFVDSNNKRNLFFSLLLFFLSLLSKETAISMLIIFPLSLYFFRDVHKSKLVSTSLLHFAVALIFLAIRYYVLEQQDSSKVSPLENSLLITTSIAERAASAILILGKYLLVLVVPKELLFDYSYNQIPSTTFSDYRVWLASIAYLILSVCAFRLLRSKSILGYAILVYLATMSLFSNLFLTIGVTMAERFLYFPSLGYCLAITWMIFKLSGSNQMYVAQKSWKQVWANNRKALLMIGFVLVLYSVKTVQRSMDWKNNLSLYKTDLAKSENNARTHAFYANELLKMLAAEKEGPENKTQELMEVVTHLKRSLAIYPRYPDALKNLAHAYFLLDSLDRSESCCRQALAIEPNAISKLGEVLFKKKDFENAITFYNSGIALHPKYSTYYFGLGLCYGAIKDYKVAANNFESALHLGMKTKEVYFLLENCYKLIGDSAAAEKYRNLNVNSL